MRTPHLDIPGKYNLLFLLLRSVYNSHAGSPSIYICIVPSANLFSRQTRKYLPLCPASKDPLK